MPGFFDEWRYYRPHCYAREWFGLRWRKGREGGQGLNGVLPHQGTMTRPSSSASLSEPLITGFCNSTVTSLRSQANATSTIVQLPHRLVYRGPRPRISLLGEWCLLIQQGLLQEEMGAGVMDGMDGHALDAFGYLPGTSIAWPILPTWPAWPAWPCIDNHTHPANGERGKQLPPRIERIIGISDTIVENKGCEGTLRRGGR